MTADKGKIIITPIGTVRSGFKKPAHRDCTKLVSEIEIDEKWAEALDNLDEFSHITVLYWMHLSAAAPPPLKIHPQHNEQLPLVGLFATRSPHRPNSIGKTVVKLLERKGSLLKVQGLDAIDGTPVIDIKPYIPGSDSVHGARVPEWIKKLHKEDKL